MKSTVLNAHYADQFCTKPCHATCLLNLAELTQTTGTTPVRSELVRLLVTLDKEYPSCR